MDCESSTAWLTAGARTSQALSVLIVVRLRAPRLLARRSLVELMHTLDSPRRGTRKGAPIDPIVRRALWTIEGVARRRLSRSSTCLYRSLGRFAMFARLGLDVRFVMAVRRAADDLDGHAWIEIDGTPFEEQIDPRMTETFVYPPRPIAQPSVAP